MRLKRREGLGHETAHGQSQLGVSCLPLKVRLKRSLILRVRSAMALMSSRVSEGRPIMK